MSKILSILLWGVLVAFLVAACVTEGQAAQPEVTLTAEIADYIAYVIAEDNIPGVAVAVVRSDEIIMLEGFGLANIETNTAVATDTVFHIGSTHKSMTAMMVASLVEDGLFEWDTPVVEIYPAFELSDPDATATVTLRHLLTMSSGIPDYAEDDLDDAALSDPLALFEALAEAPLLDAPGEEFSYSNVAYGVAGYIAALAATGSDEDLLAAYKAVFAMQVLDPISMTGSTLDISTVFTAPEYATPYVFDDDGNLIPAEPYDSDNDVLMPAGGLKTNITDMALYIQTQLAGGVAPNGTQVISTTYLSETWQPLIDDYAMGWEVHEVEGLAVRAHEGSFNNFLSTMAVIPALDVGFVILTNSEEAGDLFITEAAALMVELLVEEYGNVE